MLSNYCNRSPFIGNMVALRANATSRVRIIAQHSTVRKRSQRRVAPLSAFNDRSFSQSATEIASESIDPTLRRAVEQAVVNRRGKVTVGDVAADAGAASIGQVQRALTALATDSQAVLKVSDSGEIVYEFKDSFREDIRAKSLAIRLEPVLNKVASVGWYVVRAAFGTALLASLATVAITLSVLASSGQSDKEGRGRSYGYSGAGPSVWFNLSDLFWYYDPWYYRRYGRSRRPEEMGFLESIFSFVFGDGDPNEEFAGERWTVLGRYIQSRGGVVTAEELAPFLDCTTKQLSGVMGSDGVIVDESFVLPALYRFEGRPEVDEQGSIVYVFPSLQTSAQSSPMPVPYDAILEREWVLTKASSSQKILVGLLAAFNIIGVLSLSVALQNPRNVYVLAVNGLQGILGLMPWLQAYAVSFIAIPLFRWISIKKKNADIEDRNSARLLAAKSVQSPSQTLASKMESKKKMAQFKTVTDKNIIYRSDKALDDVEQPSDLEALEWERKFRSRQGK